MNSRQSPQNSFQAQANTWSMLIIIWKEKHQRTWGQGQDSRLSQFLPSPFVVYLCTTRCPHRLPYINSYVSRHQAKSWSSVLHCSVRTILLHYSVSFYSSPAILWKHEFVFPFHVSPALWRQWTHSSFDKRMNEWMDGRSGVYIEAVSAVSNTSIQDCLVPELYLNEFHFTKIVLNLE